MGENKFIFWNFKMSSYWNFLEYSRLLYTGKSKHVLIKLNMVLLCLYFTQWKTCFQVLIFLGGKHDSSFQVFIFKELIGIPYVFTVNERILFKNVNVQFEQDTETYFCVCYIYVFLIYSYLWIISTYSYEYYLGTQKKCAEI